MCYAFTGLLTVVMVTVFGWARTPTPLKRTANRSDAKRCISVLSFGVVPVRGLQPILGVWLSCLLMLLIYSMPNVNKMIRSGSKKNSTPCLKCQNPSAQVA
jgi:hypothetical protein